MVTRSRAGAALLLPFIAFGCKDDEDIRALTKLADNTSPPAETRPQTLPAAPVPSAGRPQMTLPNGAGFIKWAHRPDEGTARLVFMDPQSHPLEGVENATMWLVQPDGPREIRLEACRPAEPGCWQASGPGLRETLPRGIVRFEIGQERYRVELPARPPASAPASGPDTPAPLSTRGQPERPK